MENAREAAAQIRYKYICEAYEVMYEMASGEDSRTILAKSVTDGRPVIEKVMPAAQGAVYEKIKGLRHPNIAPVWDVVYHGDQCIVIMEYVSGTTLQGMIRQRGFLNAQEAVGILVQLLNGLEFLHGLGLVHRDIHPGNVLVSSDNVVKILDLGIARKVRENCSQDTSILGTVGFAAPEQYGFAQTDGRTDIYSAGVLLNVLLTGRVPKVIMAQGRLGMIVQKCTEISPEKRYADVRSLRSDLMQLQQGWQGAPGRQGAIHSGRALQPGAVQTGCRVPREIAEGRTPKKEGMGECADKPGDEADRIRRLPGFRTGRLWKQIIAVTGYGIMALSTLTLIVDAGMKQGIIGVLLEVIAMLLVFWIPYVIFTNFADWDRRIFPFRKWDKDVMIAIRIIIPIVLIYCGMMVDTYARTPK